MTLKLTITLKYNLLLIAMLLSSVVCAQNVISNLSSFKNTGSINNTSSISSVHLIKNIQLIDEQSDEGAQSNESSSQSVESVFEQESKEGLDNDDSLSVEDDNKKETEEKTKDKEKKEAGPGDIYQPKIKRFDVKESMIDGQDFELGVFYGQISIEDFGVTQLTGIKFSYHFTEDFFLSFEGGKAEAGFTSAEELFNINITDEREYLFYDVLIGWRMLPGEAFIGSSIALNSAFYFAIGGGNVDFAGENEFSLNFAAGYQVIYNDWLAFSFDTRSHMFNSELFSEAKTTINQSMSIGISIYF